MTTADRIAAADRLYEARMAIKATTNDERAAFRAAREAAGLCRTCGRPAPCPVVGAIRNLNGDRP